MSVCVCVCVSLIASGKLASKSVHFKAIASVVFFDFSMLLNCFSGSRYCLAFKLGNGVFF